MALKRLYTHGGVIDASYRGEIIILIANYGEVPYKINVGDRIAQLIVVPYLNCSDSEVAGSSNHNYELISVNDLSELDPTWRGERGFGSTGK
jgi:dUTP pyrophosphatase